jgi:hypothetical protein
MLRLESIIRLWSAISPSLPQFAMRTALISCLTLLFCVVDVCYAADKKEEQTKAAKDFKFEGVTFGTSVVQFKNLHPHAEGGKMGFREERYHDFSNAASAASQLKVYFFEGNLYEMIIEYDNSKVAKIGGNEVLIDRLSHKFGKPDANSTGVANKEPLECQMNWTMKEANRTITLIGKEISGASIDIIDMTVYTKLLEAKKKGADTGFDK